MCWKEKSEYVVLNQKNKSELFAALKEEWYQLEPERLLKLVESMPRRIKAVIKSKGYPIPY